MKRELFNNAVWVIISLVIAGLFSGGTLLILNNLHKGPSFSWDFLGGILQVIIAMAMKAVVFPSSSVLSLRALRVFYLTLLSMAGVSSAVFVFCEAVNVISFSNEMIFIKAVLGAFIVFLFVYLLFRYMGVTTRIKLMEPPET